MNFKETLNNILTDNDDGSWHEEYDRKIEHYYAPEMEIYRKADYISETRCNMTLEEIYCQIKDKKIKIRLSKNKNLVIIKEKH